MTGGAPLEIALDLTQIDNQDLGSGQYRYAADLANGLIAHAPDVRLTLLGSSAGRRDEFEPALRDPARGRYVALPPVRGRGKFYVELLRLAWWLRRQRIDVLHQLHTHLPWPKPCPVVVTAYHYYYDAPLFASRPYRYYRWAIARRADVVLAISDATREDFHDRFGVPRERIRTVYPGLSPSFARPARATRPRARRYVLSPYNLGPTKNLPALIHAWPAIAERHPDIELVLYGRSQVRADNEPAFERLLAETPGAGRIDRVGHVSDAELAGLFAGCSLFVFPTTVEGFGYPLLEAMAQGACCIARNASAMKEVGGDAVCLVETLHPDAIARAALDLLDDEPRRAALGARAADRARAFTIEEMVRGTVACYREAARGRRA